MSACYLNHKIPAYSPNSQPIPLPHTAQIAYVLLCVPSVELSKQLLKTFPSFWQFIVNTLQCTDERA